MAQADTGAVFRAVSPIPCTGIAVELLASSALTTDPNTISSVVDVRKFRRITLWIKASPDAASAYAHIFPFVSAADTEPATGDDSWFGLMERDASATATLVTGSFTTGADYTIAPEWGVVTMRPIVIRTETSDNATDEIRMAVTLDVTHARWLFVAAEEVGGNMTLQINWSGSL